MPDGSGAGPPGRQATRRGGAGDYHTHFGLCSSGGLPSRRSGATTIRRHYKIESLEDFGAVSGLCGGIDGAYP